MNESFDFLSLIDELLVIYYGNLLDKRLYVQIT